MVRDRCSCGCGSRATLHERGFTVADLPDEARLAALAAIERLLREAERSAELLDGRHHDPERFREAFRLIELLRQHATE
jgi:hypothetical protein